MCLPSRDVTSTDEFSATRKPSTKLFPECATQASAAPLPFSSGLARRRAHLAHAEGRRVEERLQDRARGVRGPERRLGEPGSGGNRVKAKYISPETFTDRKFLRTVEISPKATNFGNNRKQPDCFEAVFEVIRML